MTILQIWAIVVFAGYVVLCIFQAIYVSLYARRQWRSDAPLREAPDFSPVFVVLCVRGKDPSLVECLRTLASQNLKSFQLIASADDAHDPALEAIRAHADLFARPPIVTVALREGADGSLKCRSLLHAFAIIQRMVDESRHSNSAVVLIDADTILAPDSLERLIAPLADERIWATTGSRWFTPESGSAGAWMRQIWNAAAVVQMDLYSIPWGGMLAFRPSLLERTDWPTQMKTAFCEDTLLARVLSPHGKRVHRVPRLVADNRELTSIHSAAHFIRRQLLTTRLYHRAWPWVASHGLSIAAIHLFAIALLILSIADRDFQSMAWGLAGWGIFQACNLALLYWLSTMNRAWIATPRSAPSQPGRKGNLARSTVRFTIALFALQLIHPWAILSAVKARRVIWRGIDYEIDNQRQVRMTAYRPYTACAAPPSPNRSVD